MKKQFSILQAIKGKPSIALQHMVNGLMKQSKRRNFKINMGTYGTSHGKICYGCAATCAIQSVAKINFTPNLIDHTDDRAKRTKTEVNELDAFEGAINQARQGDLGDLFHFCNIQMSEANRFNSYFELEGGNWKKELPKVKKTISQLKKSGY